MIFYFLDLYLLHKTIQQTIISEIIVTDDSRHNFCHRKIDIFVLNLKLLNILMQNIWKKIMIKELIIIACNYILFIISVSCFLWTQILTMILGIIRKDLSIVWCGRIARVQRYVIKTTDLYTRWNFIPNQLHI